MSEEETLHSCVSWSPADDLLRDAIQTALRADPPARGELFARLLDDIEAYMKQRPEERPWTYTAFVGTDGSRIFRGAVGRSIVIDPAGTMWRARSYEDFDTAYEIAGNECRIVALTPIYETMQRYELLTAPLSAPAAL